MSYNVLLIEDDKDLNRLLVSCLEQKGLCATGVYTGAAGLCLLQEEPAFHLVVLDIMLPDLDGFAVLTQLRSFCTVPVIMLTAKNEDSDKVKGLSLGADDYLTKPFSLSEFLARVESIIRRYTVFNQAAVSPCLEFPGLKLDASQRQVLLQGEPAFFTSKEFDLLYFFACNPKKVFTKRQLYRQVWQDEYAFDDSNIMSFISKLRKKLGPCDCIETIRGVGYRFTGGV